MCLANQSLLSPSLADNGFLAISGHASFSIVGGDGLFQQAARLMMLSYLDANTAFKTTVVQMQEGLDTGRMNFAPADNGNKVPSGQSTSGGREI